MPPPPPIGRLRQLLHSGNARRGRATGTSADARQFAEARPHNLADAMRAPSASDLSFIQQIDGCTGPKPAKVPKPQSVPAITIRACPLFYLTAMVTSGLTNPAT